MLELLAKKEAIAKFSISTKKKVMRFLGRPGICNVIKV